MEKIIHQMWIGPYKMLNRDKILIEKVRRLNPDFKYMFWNNDNLPLMPDKLNKLKKKFIEQDSIFDIRLADMIRLYITYEYGGLYIDCDYDISKPLNHLNLENKDGFIHLNYGNDVTICHSIHGFNKHNLLSEYILNNIGDKWLGPHFFGEQIKSYFGINPESGDNSLIHEKLKSLNILSNNSKDQLIFDWGINHLGSATWLSEVREKMEFDENYEGIK